MCVVCMCAHVCNVCVVCVCVVCVCVCKCMRVCVTSLAWPDLFRPGGYRLDIIIASLQESGMVHNIKKS